jgi:aldehyde:ferredoxin oxidoreductase
VDLKIIRINTRDRGIRIEPVPGDFEKLGGRAFTSRWVFRYVDPEADPLGRKNQLIIAPGLLGGTPASSVHRLSVGAKSPLTSGIKESNSGGNVALKLVRLGIKAIILEEVPTAEGLCVLRIDRNGIGFESAADLKSKGTEEAAEMLHSRYGKEAGLMVIGPAGEKQLATAAILNSDREGYPARLCGRGGMGAVLGSKGIKAVVIDDDGSGKVPLADEEAFKEAARKYHDLLRSTPQTSEIYTKYGTAAMVDVTNALGGLPTKNFSHGTFEGAEKINGRALYETIVARGGDPSHACMPGCFIRSSNIYVDPAGKPVVRSLEYETMVMFGSNCGIDSLDELAEINRLCNDIGVDSIDLGGAVGIAMEAGVIPYGDAAAVKKALAEIGTDTLLGKIIGQGGAVTGKVLGARRVPAVKGQVMAAYEPRAIKGHGVTFATSTMGADHTAGFTIREGLDSHERKGQVEASGRMQVNGMIYDSLGICLFAHVAVKAHHDILAEMVRGRWGRKWGAEDLREIAADALREEKEFNRRAGLGPATDRLPEVFSEEVNPSSGTTFDFSPEELDAIEYR